MASAALAMRRVFIFSNPLNLHGYGKRIDPMKTGTGNTPNTPID
jgi:hypothetical protein